MSDKTGSGPIPDSRWREGNVSLEFSQSTSRIDLQGYFDHKKTLNPWESPRTPGLDLRQGPKGARFLMSEVPLYQVKSESPDSDLMLGRLRRQGRHFQVWRSAGWS